MIRPIALVSALALVLGAVAAGPAQARDSMVFGRAAWEEALAEQGLDPAEVVYPFDTTSEMEAFARRAVEHETEPVGKLNRLQAALFNPDDFPFNYDQRVTLTASRAFAERSGNCLAFTSLFVALSRSVGLPAFLVMVRRSPSVERDEGIVVVNRHVVAGYSQASRLYLYDFYDSSEIPYIHTRVVDDVTASALFHTNLGGDLVRADDVEGAMEHYRKAAELAPELAAPWIGLGVALYRSEHVEEALEAYLHALEAEPGNPSALTNMAYIFRRQGQDEQAAAALRAAGAGTSSPFTLIALADVEMSQNNLSAARRYLRKARRNYRDEPEVYEALSRLAIREGDREEARRWKRRAEELRGEGSSPG